MVDMEDGRKAVTAGTGTGIVRTIIGGCAENVPCVTMTMSVPGAAPVSSSGAGTLSFG